MTLFVLKCSKNCRKEKLGSNSPQIVVLDGERRNRNLDEQTSSSNFFSDQESANNSNDLNGANSESDTVVKDYDAKKPTFQLKK